MKIIFFGTPSFAKPVIDVLRKNNELVKIIRNPLKFDDPEIEELKNLNPDIFVVAAYGQILPHKVLKIPKIAAINIHPSLLPKYRGPSPIQSAILNGDEKTGVTFIEMDEIVDHGPIIEQFEEMILPDDTFESLAERLFRKSAEKIESAIRSQTRTPQDETRATFSKLLAREDGFIDVSNPPDSGRLNRMIRAFYPWPGVWTKYLLSEKEVVIKLLPNNQIQVEGKKPMNYKDFINGYSNGRVLLKKLSLI